MNAPAAVELRRIDKRFGAVHANRAVDLTVRAATVHGLVGENGAGKSTLMSILYGFYQADGGEIAVDGCVVRIGDAHDAIGLGIGMVHQHFMLVDSLSALDNVMLGAEPHWRLSAARAPVRARLQTLMDDTGLQVRLDLAVEELPVGERQRLEILTALFRGARILILDEPTAVLTPQETDTLFAVLRQLRAQGTTVLLITHKLREILALCDHVTVMRGGRVVLDQPIGEVCDHGGSAQARQHTCVNAPSVLNSALYDRLFHDGRMRSVFNGYDGLGDDALPDPVGMYRVVNGALQRTLVRVPNAAAASQAARRTGRPRMSLAPPGHSR